MKHVLLTGGGGAIGVHVLARIMADTDWRVTVLDSFHHKGYRDRISKISEGKDWSDRLQVFEHDLTCPIAPRLAAEIGNVDHIFHLAALSDVLFSVHNPGYVIHNNVVSTLNMLEYAAHADHETFVYFSTDEVYGAQATGIPAARKWDAHRPSNPYSASKAASEDLCYSYFRSGSVNLIITNTTNNFGEMQNPMKYPAMLMSKISKGEPVTVHTGTNGKLGSRYYIHSAAVADGLLHICNNIQTITNKMNSAASAGDPRKYHISGDRPLDNLELAQMIAAMMNRPLEYELQDCFIDNPAHDEHYALRDNLTDHGWTPPQELEPALQQTIDWTLANPEWLL